MAVITITVTDLPEAPWLRVDVDAEPDTLGLLPSELTKAQELGYTISGWLQETMKEIPRKTKL